jgi:hypothetical protein
MKNTVPRTFKCETTSLNPTTSLPQIRQLFKVCEKDSLQEMIHSPNYVCSSKCVTALGESNSSQITTVQNECKPKFDTHTLLVQPEAHSLISINTVACSTVDSNNVNTSLLTANQSLKPRHDITSSDGIHGIHGIHGIQPTPSNTNLPQAMQATQLQYPQWSQYQQPQQQQQLQQPQQPMYPLTHHPLPLYSPPMYPSPPMYSSPPMYHPHVMHQLLLQQQYMYQRNVSLSQQLYYMQNSTPMHQIIQTCNDGIHCLDNKCPQLHNIPVPNCPCLDQCQRPKCNYQHPIHKVPTVLSDTMPQSQAYPAYLKQQKSEHSPPPGFVKASAHPNQIQHAQHKVPLQ